MLKRIGLIAAALSLAACGANGGGAIASAGSAPATLPRAQAAVAAVADATLPPPSAISPLAKTTLDDAAIDTAWSALDIAASAADTLLAFKPSFAGTPAAKRLADALDGASQWLTIARKFQRAGQADSYALALQQASAAYAGAKQALADMKGGK